MSYAVEIELRYVILLYLKGYLSVILTFVLYHQWMAPPQPDSQEGFLQVLNLANDEVKVTVLGNENSSLLEESIKSFQVTYQTWVN